MKIYFLFFTQIFVSYIGLSQNFKYKQYDGLVNGLHSYGNGVSFPPVKVADDYGPRSYPGEPYDFHGGIDYNAPGDDEGALILAVNAGGTVNMEGMNRPGKVAIGTEHDAPNKALTVKNGIITDKVKITNIGWADHVFDSNYPLASLETVDAYLSKYGHLPGIPSGENIESSGGFELGDVTVMHQEKIEEIFLYLIALDEEINELEALAAMFEYLNNVQAK